MYQATGVHLLLDLKGVEPHLLDDTTLLMTALRVGAEKAGATVLKEDCVRFQPKGITAFLVLSESHISIHTYPDQGVAMVDAFTCGSVDPAFAIDHIRKALGGTEGTVWRVQRGFEEV